VGVTTMIVYRHEELIVDRMYAMFPSRYIDNLIRELFSETMLSILQEGVSLFPPFCLDDEF
jgi:hypothetical protein